MEVSGTLNKEGDSKGGRPTFRGDVGGWLVILYGPKGEQVTSAKVTVEAPAEG